MSDPSDIRYYIIPRTSRAAFGSEFRPLSPRISFHAQPHSGRGWIAAAVILLIVLAGAL